LESFSNFILKIYTKRRDLINAEEKVTV